MRCSAPASSGNTDFGSPKVGIGPGVVRLPDGEGRVEGVDFPSVALREARWQDGVLRLQLVAQHERLRGESTTLRVTGLAEPEAWTVDGPAGTTSRVEQGALVVTAPLVEEGLSVRRSG